MSTLAQMRSRIADDLNKGTTLNTQIDKAINRAIEHYEKQRFWFNETLGTFATIANQSAYGTADGIPSDIAEIDYLEITSTSTYKLELKRKGFPYVINTIGNGGTSTYPSCFALFQEKIYLAPIPSAVKTITLYYQQKYTALSLDADTNDWTTDAEDLIESRARWWVYKRIIKDKDHAAEAKAEELEALDALIEKTRKFSSTGYIIATDF